MQHLRSRVGRVKERIAPESNGALLSNCLEVKTWSLLGVYKQFHQGCWKGSDLLVRGLSVGIGKLRLAGRLELGTYPDSVAWSLYIPRTVVIVRRRKNNQIKSLQSFLATL